MKRLIYTLLFTLPCLFILDRAGGRLMHSVVRHSDDVLCPKLCYISDSIHEDVVLMGASRCHHHYIPTVLADTLGMSVYNAGVGGSNNIFSHYIVLQHILARCTPRVVCLEVMPTDYCRQADAFNVVSFFAPLFGQNERADSVYRLAGQYWPYRVSHLYRYNAKAASSIIGLAMNRQAGGDHGYVPLPAPKTFPEAPTYEVTDTSIDSLKISYLQRFIDQCREREIRLFFVASPKFSVVDTMYYAPLKAIASENNIPFLDYHSRGLYLDHPEYFKDESHLWEEGARHYTDLIASDLKRILMCNIVTL